LAKFVSLLKYLPTRLVQVLNSPVQGLVSTLAGIKEQKEKA
jgi:hypothetical protein